MNTSRRNFLKWSGFSALGAVVFSGCGIPETELLVESPAQLPEDLVSGLEAWYATSCGHCGVGEGVLVRVIEGRAIKIEGNPDHPISRGKTSVRCQAGLQVTYNPGRITSPKRLVGSRGSGQYEDISWDDALQQVADILKGQNDGSSILMTEPLRGSLGMVAGTFMEGSNGSHIAFEPLETTVLRAALKEVFGVERIPDFDIAHADYLVNFGADFLATEFSPVRYSGGYGHFRQGGDHRGTFHHIGSRFSMTAANSDKWIFVTPGHEGDVAMSIAYVLVTEHSDQIDNDAMRAFIGTNGLASLEQFRPGTVSATSGVAEGQIREVAKQLVEHEHSLVMGGGAAAATSNGLYNMVAIYFLNHLLGNVGKTGGVLPNPGFPLEHLPATATGASFAEWQTVTDKMRDGKVKLAMIHGANPVYGLPAATNFGDALNSVEKIVSFSSFMDETTAMADLILPDHTYLESWGDDIPEPGPGYQTITFQQPVVRPFLNTKPFGDALLDLSRRIDGNLGDSLPWSSMKDVLQDTAQKLYGLQRGSVQASSFDAFWNTALQRGGWWDINASAVTPENMPNTLPRESVAPVFEGPAGDDSYYLVPFASNSLTDGRGANLPWLQGATDPLTTIAWRTWIEINSRKAAELDIKEGDELELQSPSGTIRGLAYPHPGVSPDVLCVPMGQGHTEYGNYEIGPDLYRNSVGTDRGGSVFSALAAKQVDNAGGLAWASTRVTITKTGNWVRMPKFESHSVVPAYEAVEEHIPIRPPEHH